LFPQKPQPLDAWEGHLDAVAGMLERTLDDFRIDRQRISLTGVSQGARGCWSYVLKDPQRWSAVLAICGYVGTPGIRAGANQPRFHFSADAAARNLVRSLAGPLRQLPTWVFHGDADQTVSWRQSELLVQWLAEEQVQLQFTTLHGAGHVCWDQAYQSAGVAKFLLQRSKNAPTR
jgi:predicted peptidase